jgi:hypothetical protein
MGPERESAQRLRNFGARPEVVFEVLALDILRDVGRPMRSSEFVEEFRKREQPLAAMKLARL